METVCSLPYLLKPRLSHFWR